MIATPSQVRNYKIADTSRNGTVSKVVFSDGTGHFCWSVAVWQQRAADRCFAWLFGCGDAYGACLDKHCLVQA